MSVYFLGNLLAALEHSLLFRSLNIDYDLKASGLCRYVHFLLLEQNFSFEKNL